MRKGYGLLPLVLAALMAAVGTGGCRLVIGFEDAVLDTGGAGGHGGVGGESASCSDGMKNGNETGKDCGGSCAPCPVGGGCVVGPDCVSKVCTSGSCAASACDDKVKNADETDVDCGGNCPPCGPGTLCADDADCKSGQCMGGACVSTCTDAARGGKETDVDCGGGVASNCDACANGKACKVGSDCVSAVCIGGVCLDNYVWAKDLGGTGALTSVSGMALDALGNATVVGTLNGSTDFGGGKLTSVGGDNVFVARYDSLGKPLSAMLSGYAGNQSAAAVAVDIGGNSLVVGDFEANFALGCSFITGAGGTDVFVAKLSSSGACLWNEKFGDSFDQHAKAVSTDAMGNVAVMGDFEGSLTFGGSGSKLTSLGGDIFLAKLDPSGAHVWSQRFGDADEQRASALVVDGAGNVVVAGLFLGSIKFGSTPLVDVDAGAFDVFLAKFDGLGKHVWSRSFAVSVPFAEMSSLAVDTAGNVYATGTFVGGIDLGGGGFASDGTPQMFVAKFDDLGKHIWSKAFNAGQKARGTSVALDSAGNLVVTAVFTGTVDFGGGPFVSAGTFEGVVLKLDANGEYLWGRHFGSDVGLLQRGVAYDPANVLVVGPFGGSPLDFGGGPLTSVGTQDMFLARLRTP